MAKYQGKVYLGYEEELIAEKNHSQLNYTINKIGGLPDWPPFKDIKLASKCPLCSLHRLLIVQCYAPLEGSVYHRTLYVFACINPTCWTQSESWTCVRSQIKDEPSKTSAVVCIPSKDTNLSWCKGSDDWDENDNGDATNGNVMFVDNNPLGNSGMQRNSDEEDESNSYDLETVEQALGNLQVDAHNANLSPVQGAVGAIGAPVPVAELEGGDESGLVIVETPTAPINNMEMLFNQMTELPPDIRTCLLSGPLQFVPKYIYVEEEWNKTCNDNDNDKVTELLNQYKRDNEIEVGSVADRVAAGGSGCDEETYEDAAPLHGDRLFHAFLTRLHQNPGQILRYSREEPPLLGAPLPTSENTTDSPHMPTVCKRCGSGLVCELQLVPAFADTLRIHNNNLPLTHLHFLSVLIFTCSQSCWQPNDRLVEETVLFQPEVI
ncbi:programmed cell death protein 2-like [Pararge aegeria]|uniref:Jg1524 protein n=1 Tax=Pararge aegeria aegeria TaxID=348720 RepID=A0A8S4RMS8_9NEOP|nr:programmed cell death protein 2-like [Pararge aegeria]CAH2239222.1 jg1524 [Pararge aegeria aegeria]